MPRFRFLLSFIVPLIFTLPAVAQTQAPPPKPQTARQAVIEIVTKGGDAVQKHLTVEVQQVLKAGGKLNSGPLMMLNSMQTAGLHSFDTGAVLFAYEDPDKQAKYEVHIDNDDLAGDQEESFQLSIHEFRDGKEEKEDLGLLSPSFTVFMKLQQNIWRLDRIAISAEIPIGDPNFVESAFVKPAAGTSARSGLGANAGDRASMPDLPGGPTPADRVVQQLAIAETMFARMHPETGFSCSLSELAEISKILQIDPQVNGGIYNGYHFSLSGCEGKPAGSFQVLAEPAVATPNAKAYCTDATQNVRASDDGRGGTCLSSGKPLTAMEGVTGDTVFLTPHLVSRE